MAEFCDLYSKDCVLHMAINAQFLFFYVDELIQHHWVDWIEGPLSNIPALENRDERGFQKTLGDLGAGPRTRAGEAYKLGMLSGRIVKPQVAGAGIPSGWEQVIEGELPSTRLGYYAYIIGKALRTNPDDPNLQKALDCLACIQILHIGFVSEGRWYSTVLFFRYALKQFEIVKGSGASDDEKRYLAAAVINTLESESNALLLQPYKTNTNIQSLVFDLSDKGLSEFSLSDLSEIVENKTVGINAFNKTKAALFWAQNSRGIYTRAERSPGVGMLDELMAVDQKQAAAGNHNLLSETLEAIEKNEDNSGIFENAEASFSNFPDLFAEWQDLESELFSATNSAVENANLDEMPDVWLAAQHIVREEQTGSPKEMKKSSVEPDEIEPQESNDEEAPDLLKKAVKKRKPIELPTHEELNERLEGNFGDIQVDVPEHSGRKVQSPKTARVSKKNYAEQDARNRKLGEAGERFVLEFERHKLRLAGRADLAERVVWASQEIGDGLGYDIVSFSEAEEELLIEVKTTQGGSATPFFLSSNEVVVSRDKSDQYLLYRVFDFSKAPKLFVLAGSLEEKLDLQATSYRARLT